MSISGIHRTGIGIGGVGRKPIFLNWRIDNPVVTQLMQILSQNRQMHIDPVNRTMNILETDRVLQVLNNNT